MMPPALVLPDSAAASSGAWMAGESSADASVGDSESANVVRSGPAPAKPMISALGTNAAAGDS